MPFLWNHKGSKISITCSGTAKLIRVYSKRKRKYFYIFQLHGLERAFCIDPSRNNYPFCPDVLVCIDFYKIYQFESIKYC